MEKPSTVDRLNSLLETEIAALEYYRIHAQAMADVEIAEGIRAILPAEESHARNLAVRIRDLGGDPVPEPEAAVRRGVEMGQKSKEQGTVGMLRLELSQEQEAIRDYARGVAAIEDDMVTLEMLEEHLLDEMRHAKWLKMRLSKLESQE